MILDVARTERNTQTMREDGTKKAVTIQAWPGNPTDHRQAPHVIEIVADSLTILSGRSQTHVNEVAVTNQRATLWKLRPSVLALDVFHAYAEIIQGVE